MSDKAISAIIMVSAIIVFSIGWLIAASRLGGKKTVGLGGKFIWKLEQCGSPEEMRNYFTGLGMRLTVQEMFECLREYMCISGYAGCGRGSIDEQFEMLCETFLNGRWRQIANKYNFVEMSE